jgi:succinate-semialdehyde dehydrogenase/glutarate-semialdehyde dehydrogenase
MNYTDLYIDGQWRSGQSGDRFDVINPATEEIITSVASAEIADADAALDAAETAMKEWASRTPRSRSEVF